MRSNADSRFRARAVITAMALGLFACGGEQEVPTPLTANAPQPVGEPAPETTSPAEPEKLEPGDVRRFPPEHVRQRVSEAGALLVCAYDSDEKFEGVRLTGAISRSEFEERIAELPKDAEVFFY